MTTRKSAIIGVGMTPVGEHWDRSLRELAADAVETALDNAGYPAVDALFVANAYSATFNHQTQLGALIADFIGLSGVEAWTVEAGDASGSAALRAAHLAVASGEVQTALVIGVEKSTDIVGSARTEARGVSLDADYEVKNGATLSAMAALLMRRYMHTYNLDLSVFEGFSVNAHRNGQQNPFAMYRNALRAGAFSKAPMVADPVSLFDGAPDGDGAAALVVTSAAQAPDRVSAPVYITGSAASTDTFMVQERADMLTLIGVQHSTQKALAQAAISRDNVDLFEMHDSFTILSALTLEAAGYAGRGAGWQLAQDDIIGLQGTLPVSTFGGLKSRGNPAGASGVYQAVEAVHQLRGVAEANQVPDARTAMIQGIGGLGSTVITHILQM